MVSRSSHDRRRGFALLDAILGGALLALGLALRHRALLACLRRLAWSLWGRLAVGAAAEPSPYSLRFPYAVAIGAGAVVALVWL